MSKQQIKFVVNGKIRRVEVRPPSLFNRNQFIMLVISIFGEKTDIDVEDVFTLNMRDFRRFLRVSLHDESRVSETVDLEVAENYSAAQLAIRTFFLTVAQTMNSLPKSTGDITKSNETTTAHLPKSTQ